MPLVGDVLAERYRILGPLGAGGMASVWRASDLRLGREVAVKILLPNLSADPSTAARFDREARSLAAAAHPNVVSVFDVDPGDAQVGREPFYVMELCDGGSLAERLTAAGVLPPHELAPIISAAADGLADLHRRVMVHRDVKPHNILFCDGRAKLADFGLARTEGDELEALTATGTTIGTLAYLAPELLAGGTASPASDVYALAVVAFQGLTGRLPRPAGSVTDVVEARSAAAATVSQAAPELGTGFDAVLAPALAPDPGLRPSPEALAAGLTAAVATGAPSLPADDQPTVIVPPPDIRVAEPEAVPPAWLERSRLPHGRKPQRSGPRPALFAIGASALVVLGLLAASGILGDRRPGGPGGASATPRTAVTARPATPAAATPVPVTPPPVTAPPGDPAAQPGIDAVRVFLARVAEARAAGLPPNDATDLERRAQQIEADLRRGDLGRARDRAEMLVERVDKVEDQLPDSVADPLIRAAEALRDAIPKKD